MAEIEQHVLYSWKYSRGNLSPEKCYCGLMLTVKASNHEPILWWPLLPGFIGRKSTRLKEVKEKMEYNLSKDLVPFGAFRCLWRIEKWLWA